MTPIVRSSRTHACAGDDDSEERLVLTINREKTRVVNLKGEGKAVDFLGYTFRYDRDLNGGSHTYLNMAPSTGALERERENIRKLINTR